MLIQTTSKCFYFPYIIYMCENNKYLKYKTKYLELKKLIGGAANFGDLKYLGSGADNVTFLLSNKNNTIIRIRKGCMILEDNELETVNKMINNTPLYFVKILKVGECNDIKDKLTSEIENVKDFCNDNNSNNTTCNYTYIIMENASGINLLHYYGECFKNLLTSTSFDLDINNESNKKKMLEYINFLFGFFIKMVDGLISANDKLGGFIHGDLNFRNCNVENNTNNPIIYDFGASSIGEINNNQDILNYIKDILTDTNLDAFVYRLIFTNYDTLHDSERKLIKENFYKLNKTLRQNKKIESLLKYFNQSPTSYGGVRLNFNSQKFEPLAQFKESLEQISNL